MCVTTIQDDNPKQQYLNVNHIDLIELSLLIII